MSDAAFTDFVARIAARTPAPGGGAAAARTASMGAALCAMVLRFAAGRAAHQNRLAAIESAISAIDRLIERIGPLDERDMAAFSSVLEAYRMQKDDPARLPAIQSSLDLAMRVPTEICGCCRDVLREVEPLATCISRNIVADLGTGAELLLAATRSARLMVQINASALTDAHRGATAVREVDDIVEDVESAHARLCLLVQTSIGGPTAS